MSKRTWCTWAFTGVFGVAVAGAGVASNHRPSLASPTETARAARVTPNATTNVNQLLKAYGIVRLPAVKPATEAVVAPPVAEASVQPTFVSTTAAEHPEASAAATDQAVEKVREYQITRLPGVEPTAATGSAAAAPVEAASEQFNSQIIRTGRFEPSDQQQSDVRDASSMGWYEVGINKNAPDRKPTVVRRPTASRDENYEQREELEPGRIARRDSSRSILSAPTQGRYADADDQDIVRRQSERRADDRVLSVSAEEGYSRPRTSDDASRYEQDRLRPAPLRQRYVPASYAGERTAEPAELRDAPSGRSLRPDDVANAITSRREMLMVDEDRFTAAPRQPQYDPAWQAAPHATMARYRVEDQVASPAYQGAEGIVYPPGGPNLVYGDGSGQVCGPLCDPCACSCGWLWVFGTETTMLFANRNDVDAAVQLATPNDRINATADDSLAIGPRIWFGARSCKWEVLGRMWIIGDVFNDHDPLLFGTTDRTGTFQCSDLEAYTADAEIVRHFCCGPCWDIYCGVGFRYASLEQVARVTGTIYDTQAVPGFGYADAIAYNQIDGPGLTAVFGGSRLLHCYCHSSLNAFWNVRGSMIWGDVDTTAQTTVQALDTLGAAAAARIDAAYANTQGDMIIGELQVGLRWCHPLRCIPAVASVHVAFETQWWDADGGFAFTNGVAVANNIGAAAQASSGPNMELSLIGGTVGCGITF